MKKIEIIKKEIDDTHYYFVNGEFYPGVTTILDEAAPVPFGLREFFKQNTPEQQEDIKKTSLELGSKMHDAYEKLLNGIELNLKENYPTTKEKKHIVSFYQWFQDFQPKNFETEQVVASLDYKFAGTLDFICEKDNETWLIDFKTSKFIGLNYELQVAAYKQAYEEMTGKKVDHMAILRTASQHKCGYEFKEVNREFDEFMNVYRMYLSLHCGVIPEPPLTNVYPETLKLYAAQN